MSIDVDVVPDSIAEDSFRMSLGIQKSEAAKNNISNTRYEK